MNTHKKFACTFKVKEISESGTFSGYGSVFNVKDSYKDMVIKGAFANTLANYAAKGKMPKLLWQHDTREPIGVYTKMEEDNHGLYVEGKILVDAGPLEKRAHAHLMAGSVDSLSIGYTIPKGGYEYSKDFDAYLIKQVDLWEVSLVTFPANADALVDSVKAALDGGPKEFERFLRDAGLSRQQAKGLMSRGFEGLRDLRDADEEDPSLDAVKSLVDSMRAMRGGK